MRRRPRPPDCGCAPIGRGAACRPRRSAGVISAVDDRFGASTAVADPGATAVGEAAPSETLCTGVAAFEAPTAEFAVIAWRAIGAADGASAETSPLWPADARRDRPRPTPRRVACDRRSRRRVRGDVTVVASRRPPRPIASDSASPRPAPGGTVRAGDGEGWSVSGASPSVVNIGFAFPCRSRLGSTACSYDTSSARCSSRSTSTTASSVLARSTRARDTGHRQDHDRDRPGRDGPRLLVRWRVVARVRRTRTAPSSRRRSRQRLSLPARRR